MNIQQYQLQSSGPSLQSSGPVRHLLGGRFEGRYNPNQFATDLPANRFNGRQGTASPPSIPMMQQSMPQMNQYQFRSPGLLPPGGQPPMMAGTSRRRYRRPGYRQQQRDINGNVPGEWDYQMGQSPGLQPPASPYGQQQGGYQFTPQPYPQMMLR